MIERVIKILLLEDRKAEAEFTKRAVLRKFPNAVFTVAEGKSSFLERIDWFQYDIVLGDYHLPDYNGLEALLHVRQKYPEMPFVFVTGTLNSEEKAAQAILHGANGYVLKDNVRSLGEVVEKVLMKSEEDIAKATEQKRRKMDMKIRLQRASTVLAKAPEFTDKAFIDDLLLEVTQTL